MPYYHIITKTVEEGKYKCLFSDLSENDLKKSFIQPYERGNTFLSGNDLFNPADLRSIKIIRTERPDKIERDEINRKACERIDRINRADHGVFIMSLGGGYDAEDIAEAGEDVTSLFIKREPGFKAGRSKFLFGWIAGIATLVISGGILKWLGWV